MEIPFRFFDLRCSTFSYSKMIGHERQATLSEARENNHLLCCMRAMGKVAEYQRYVTAGLPAKSLKTCLVE